MGIHVKKLGYREEEMVERKEEKRKRKLLLIKHLAVLLGILDMPGRYLV